jgi:hypothetical protein
VGDKHFFNKSKGGSIWFSRKIIFKGGSLCFQKKLFSKGGVFGFDFFFQVSRRRSIAFFEKF